MLQGLRARLLWPRLARALASDGAAAPDAASTLTKAPAASSTAPRVKEPLIPTAGAAAAAAPGAAGTTAGPTMAAAAAYKAQERFKPSAGSYVLFAPSVVCAFLAYWQWQRSQWKEGLIETRKQMLAAEPQSVYELDELQDYRKVSASGRFIHQRSIFVGPRPRSIPGQGIRSGYFLITPLFDPERKGAVLVNRGWVPSDWLNDIDKVSQAHDAVPTVPQPAASQPASQPKRKAGWFGWASKQKEEADQPQTPVQPAVKVVGVLQPSEQPSAVIPNNVPDNLEFHWVDVPALATVVGLPPDTPLVQAISDDPSTQQPGQQQSRAMPQHASFHGAPSYPIAKNTSDLVNFTTMPRDHLTYTAIWACLSLVLVLMGREAIFKPPKRYRIAGFNAREAWAARTLVQ